VKDKHGVQIFLRDTVKYEGEIDSMGLLGECEGTALLFPTEDTIQVQSLRGGVPIMMKSADVEVSYSLVQQIAALGSSADLQELVINAEVRYDTAVENAKTKRKSGTSTRAKKQAKPNPFAVAAAKKKAENE
jgi:hypothetical protein